MSLYCKYSDDAPVDYNCILPAFLDDKEIASDLPFTHPSTRDEDQGELHACLPRVLSILQTLAKREKPASATKGPTFDASKACPFASYSSPDAPPAQAEYYGNFNNFRDDNIHSMRVVINDVKKLLSAPKTFIIGFFSNMGAPTDGVVNRVWGLDERLVAALAAFPCILGYFTCRKADGDYYNYVFLEDESAVQKWRCFSMHGSAITLSPLYYNWVRINHAVLPCSLASIMDIPGGEKKLEIIRTKYFLYKDTKCVWRGIRKYKQDEVFHSVPEHQRVSPFVFASFGRDDEYAVHKQTVEQIGKATGLPVKMINIAALAPRDGADEGPSDFSLIQEYNIDFAFTSASTFALSFPNLNALVAPVYSEAHDCANPVDDAARAHALAEEMVVASVWVPLRVQHLVRNMLARMHKVGGVQGDLLAQCAYKKYAPVSAYEDYL